MAGRNPNQALNIILANVLRDMNPQWRDRIEAEQTRNFVDHLGRQPDILIRHPNGLPVIVETEFAPGSTVESDARSRLGETLQLDDTVIEQTIAVRMPEELSIERQGDLSGLIQKTTDFEFCVFPWD